jgi:hypothetical protein
MVFLMLDLLPADRSLVDRIVAYHRTKGSGRPFAYPPATEEQVTAAERAIGFGFPAILRMLYLHVGNGGFGPYNAILGVKGGYTDEDLGKSRSIVGVYRIFRQFRDSQGLETWPKSVVPYLNWGCGRRSCLDCRTGEGQVYLFAPGDRKPQQGQTWDDCLIREALSFRAWLEKWLEDPDFSNRSSVGCFV